MTRAAVQVQRERAGFRTVEPQPELPRHRAKVPDDGRQPCFRRNLPHAAARQRLARNGQHGHTFRIDPTFHKHRSYGVHHILARRLAMPAQCGQALGVLPCGHGVRGRDALEPSVAFAPDLGEQFDRFPALPLALIELRARHAAGVAIQLIELFEAITGQHHLRVVLGDGQCRRLGRQRAWKRYRVQSSREHDHAALLPRNRRCHGLFANQRSVGRQRGFGQAEPHHGTIRQHAAEEPLRRLLAVVEFEQVVPKVIAIARAGGLAGGIDELAVRKERLAQQRPWRPPVLAARRHDQLGQREIDEFHARARGEGGSNGRQFG